MMTPPDDPRLLRVRTRKQLLAEGYDDRAITRSVRAGLLHRVRHGSYVDARAWAKLDEAAQHAVLVRAAYATARTGTVISHASALPFYDAPTWGFDLSEAHLTRTDHKAGRREAGVCQHRGRILEEESIEVAGLRIVSASRLALEVTTLGSTEAAMVVVCYLLHHGLTTLDQLRARLASSFDRWPDTLSTRVVLRLADGRVESPGEARTLYLCWAEGLPIPVPQHEVRDRDGTLIGRVDFAWPEHKVFLEFDGRTKYSKYLRGGETPADAVFREKRREERICELTGWRCIRITWSDLAHPERTAARIRAMLAGLAA